ncbi:methyl-CpG-binding domain protein 1-like isoform X3 [Dromiciops gliroides]|uniref:methyl-CpG-binding domain protein 1-like isoform X3 n=1 Tax=Dromiciops gliroides TaxID=33562 RepID=UPI001CC56A2F|nr:methyl-CpG-binding domain protein 1-like isoform X3 [Dromiciops gliroides]
MAEEWLDCPALGPGWKRRESFRKSGATCGRSDTYYQSPTGERIRSKVELTRFLGPDCDLRCFDFKRGVLQYLPAKASSQKRKRRAWPKKTKPSRKEKQPPEPRLGPPAPQGPVAMLPFLLRWCENCGTSISGDGTGRQRLRSLCKGCRAQRNAFNREQRMFKRVGCGDCKACQVTEDCGVCSACVVQPPQPGSPQHPQSLCVQRRCLKIVTRSFGCGRCSGCQTKEDCGACRICERKGKPGLKRQWKCIQRRCLKKRKMKRPRGAAARKLPGRRRRGLVPPPPTQAVSPSSTAKKCMELWGSRSSMGSVSALALCFFHQSPWAPSSPAQDRSQVRCLTRLPTVVTRYSICRQSRKCGACAACRRRVDCGQCDFCQDKPKFGGCNQKRQKCRWRQCLQFAMKRLLPTARWASPAVEGAALSPRRARRSRRRKGASAKSGGLRGQRLVTEALSSGLEEYECPGLGVFISSPAVKQELESYGDQAPGAASPPPEGFSPGLPSKGANRAQLQHSLKQEENLGKGEEEEETEAAGSEAAKANTPVIMEIYSLSGATPTAAGPCGGLDSVLQEFLGELNELPLPAHWEVLPPRGPDLCIVQRSPLSTMAAAVIHIQPGLYFHVVVQDVPVPPTHELYSAHPLRLTTVDEVVELICNLEAYHLCPGWPGSWQQGPRSPDCHVLVYGGRCQACCRKTCPSGSSRS